MRRALWRVLALAVAAMLTSAGGRALAAEADSRTNPMLQRALKAFPQADANGDGILTMSEARAAQKTLLPAGQGIPARKAGAAGKAKGAASDSAPASSPALAAASSPAGSTPASKRAKKTPAPAAADCPTPTFADVSYGPYERNLLDFWQAKSDAPTPVVVFIHGGGFVNGSKDKIRSSPRVLIQCLDHGVSFASISYRYRTQAPLVDVLHDTARAIQFLRFKAGEWNIDKTRVASYGGSAGAGSSLWIGFHDDLADPDNPDPVLRESSRLTALGANSCQCTYDVTRWREIIGPYPGEAPRPKADESAGPQGDEELGAPDEPGAPTDEKSRKELDMLGMLTPDDPPVYLYSKMPNTPPTDRGHYVHHPKHAIAVKEKCDELGIESVLILADTPLPEGKTPDDVMLEFFFKHLKVD
ncbi:MAG: alpha/beta hydrolase [Candidatus Sumerlaeota bacterium]|nr:alpha/beta hydrolase [Candidatus Sumerlaeota bacterium]